MHPLIEHAIPDASNTFSLSVDRTEPFSSSIGSIPFTTPLPVLSGTSPAGLL